MMKIVSRFRNMFRTQAALTAADTERGTRLLTVDGVCSMSMATLQGGPFLPAFALALGAGSYEIGLITTILFLSQLMQLPGVFVMRYVPSRRAFVAICAAVSRGLWVFIILIPLLFYNRGVTFLLQWLLIASLAGALAGPAWNSLLRDIVPQQNMGSIFARRLVVGNLFIIALTLAGGQFVKLWRDRFPEAELAAYSLLFAVGLGFGLVGIAAITRLPEPAHDHEAAAEPVLATVTAPVGDRNFRGLVWFIACWNFAINLAAPFFIIYMMKRIGLTLGTVTWLFVLNRVANVFFLRIWGRLADRFSNKSVIAVSAPLFLLSVLLWTFTTLPERHALTMPLLIAIHVLSGIALAGVSLATANIALKLSPKGKAHSYMTCYGLAGAVAGAAAPMLGGTLADFFASRELALTLNWAAPDKVYAVHALSLRALDFLFVIALVGGVMALKLLGRVAEAGEVEEDVVRDELKNEMLGGLRNLSAVAGVRHLVTIPVAAVYRAVQPTARQQTDEQTDEQTDKQTDKQADGQAERTD